MPLPRSDSPSRPRARLARLGPTAAKIAAGYVVFAGLYIYGSDWAVTRLGGGLDSIRLWQTLKGWAFVALTGLLLYAVLRRVLRRMEAVQGQLRENEERLRLALVAANQGLYDLDVQTGEARVSPEYATMLGYDPADFHETNARWIERLHPDDRAAVADTYRAYIEGRIPTYQVEFRQRTRTGDWKWILSLGQIVERDAQGRPRRMLGTHTDITERKQVEAALRASEEKYRRLFDLESDALFLVEKETGQIIEANASATTMYGFSHEELLARRNVDLSAEPEQTRAATAAQLPQIPTRWHRKQDGTVFPVEIHASHFRFGGRDMHLAVIRDITERLRTQQALVESERKWRQVLVNTPQIGVSLDPQGRIVFANQYLLELTGWREEEVLGQDWFDWFVPAQTRPSVREVFRTVMSTRDTAGFSTYENELVTRSGQRRNIAWSNVLTKDAQGTITDVTCLGVDLTERQRAENALRESETHYRRFFECDLTGDFVSTPEGRILDCNLAFARMLGFESVAAVLASDPTTFYTGPQERQHFIERLQREKVLENLELEVIRRDGAIITVVENVVGMFDAEGRLFQWFGYMFDITQRKQAERALQDLTGRLLRLQDEERRRIARELHDTTVQNLAALNMNLAVLEQEAPATPPRLRALLADCQALTDRSAQEIRTLSYLLHPPLLDEFGLGRAMRDYAEGFAQRSGLLVELDLPEDVGRLPAPVELALFRVLQESLGNVYRHSGSPVARIALRRGPAEVVLEIADQGHGLPPGGVGGGLAGVGIFGMQERLRQLGGRLTIESGLPGVRVRATLPLS